MIDSLQKPSSQRREKSSEPAARSHNHAVTRRSALTQMSWACRFGSRISTGSIPRPTLLNQMGGDQEVRCSLVISLTSKKKLLLDYHHQRYLSLISMPDYTAHVFHRPPTSGSFKLLDLCNSSKINYEFTYSKWCKWKCARRRLNLCFSEPGWTKMLEDSQV